MVLWASTTVTDSSWQAIFERLKNIDMEAVFIAMFNGEFPVLNRLDLFDGFYIYNILGLIQNNAQVVTQLAQTYDHISKALHYYLC